MLVLVSLFLQSIWPLLISGQYIEKDLCFRKCLCLPTERVIACHENDKLRAVPTNIDKSITRLIVQKGRFDNPRLYRRNLTGLEHLTFLKIIYYNLRYIEPETFLDMGRLQYLDLSHNKLLSIASYAFRGLSLVELHLMENANIRLQPDSFDNMTAHSINMRSNNISYLDYDLYRNTKLKYLYLFNNQLTTLNPKFQSLFTDPDSVLDVSNNPIVCDCSISWFADFLSARFNRGTKKFNISCDKPKELFNKQLMFLKPDELKCSPLTIDTVKLQLDMKVPQLTCVSRIGGFRPPRVAWKRFSDEFNTEVISGSSIVELTNENDYKTLSSTHNTINLTANFFENGITKLLCWSSTDSGMQQRLEIHIHKVQQFVHTRNLYTTNPIINQSRGGSILFVKHFSIMEMFGAILGTFVVTFLGLLAMFRYLRSYQNKLMNKNDFMDLHRSVNAIKPCWYVPQGNSSTYSIPRSHTDYDSPATLDRDHGISDIYTSYPTKKNAFLDYKTHTPIVA